MEEVMHHTPRVSLHLAWSLILYLGSVPAAKANLILPFFYSIPSDSSHSMAVSAFGTLTTTGLLNGAYTVTGISGTWNGYTITGLLPPGSYGDNDNLLFPAGPHLDDSGITFQVNAPGDDGSGDVNVYYDGSGYTEYSDDVGYTQSFNVTFPPNYFNFSYAFPGHGSTPMAVSASGILTTIQTGSGTYLVTDISGTWNGLSILGLAPVNTYGSNDNLLLLASPHLTDNGITFTVPTSADDGNGNVNVFYDFEQGSYTEYSDNVGHGNFGISASAPEPSSWLLFLSILAACFGYRTWHRLGHRGRP
jgi:hypothetical protein